MSTRQEVTSFTAEQLSEFLRRQETLCEETVGTFLENRIDGKAFFELNDSDLREIITPLGDRKSIVRIISSFGPRTAQQTVVATPQSAPPRDPSWVENVIPIAFSRRTTEAIKEKMITKTVRSEIVEVLSYRVFAITMYPTPDEYTSICRALVAKYPALADTIGNGYGSWKLTLRQRMKNMRRPPKGQKRSQEDIQACEDEDKENQPTNKPSKKRDTREDRAGTKVTTTTEGSTEYETDLDILTKEHEKSKPSSKVVRRLMKATFHGRRQWILSEAPSVGDVLKSFPSMKRTRYLERELMMITELENCEHVDDKWAYFSIRIEAVAKEEAKHSPKMKQLLESHMQELEGINDECQGLLEVTHLLEVLTLLACPRSKAKLIYRFSMDNDLNSKILALTVNHPYIALVIGESSAQVFFVAERCVLEEVKKTFTTLFGLIAIYFSFNMEYPRSIYPVLIFIQHFILLIRDKQPVPNSVTKLLSSLDNLHVAF